MALELLCRVPTGSPIAAKLEETRTAGVPNMYMIGDDAKGVFIGTLKDGQ